MNTRRQQRFVPFVAKMKVFKACFLVSVEPAEAVAVAFVEADAPAYYKIDTIAIT